MPAGKSKQLKALVVEDQAIFREAVADELSFLGFEASTAKDGEEGLKAALATDFDLILSDMRMPNKDGRWFLNELRKTKKSSPPFIFVTGFTDLAPEDAFEMGADAFLAKPLDADKLSLVLAKVCSPFETRWSEQPALEPAEHIEKVVPASESRSSFKDIALGRGGMFLATDQTSLRIGQTISFAIQFEGDNQNRLEGYGTIIWKREPEDELENGGYGIDFDYISPSTLPYWLNYLRTQEMVPVIPTGRLPEPNGN